MGHWKCEMVESKGLRLNVVLQSHLDEGSHVGEVSVHGTTVRKVLIHSLHELGETAEGQSL